CRRFLAIRHVRVRRYLADRLPCRPAEDRRSRTCRARHRGPHPAVRLDSGTASGAGYRVHARLGRRRSAQHRLDASRRSQRRTARFHRLAEVAGFSGGAMTGPFTFIATNRLKPGMLDAETARVPGLVEFVHTQEPGVIAFNEYVNGE